MREACARKRPPSTASAASSNKDDGSVQAQTMTYIARNVLIGRAAMMEHRPADAAIAFAQAAELQESDDFTLGLRPAGLALSRCAAILPRHLLAAGDLAGRAARSGGRAQVPAEGSGHAGAAVDAWRNHRRPLGGARWPERPLDDPALQAPAARSARSSAACVGWIVKLVAGLFLIGRPVGAGLSLREPADHDHHARRRVRRTRGARDWMPIGQIDRDMVRAAIAARGRQVLLA